MLAKFKVSNFKSFEKNFSFDLTDTNGYTFNDGCVVNGIVNNALIYGHNGVGKSNIGLALFDIIEHLTDQNKSESEYSYYLNAYNEADYAEFYFEFLIDCKKVVYEYKKTDYKSLIFERFSIDDVELAFIDRTLSDNANFNFKGAENLKTEIKNNELSILKYVKNNTSLDDNEINKTFNKFFDFIEGMLFFRSLQKNQYLGYELGNKNVHDEFVEKYDIKELENFFNKAGIECKLEVIESLEKKTLVFDFNGKHIPFFSIASQGTRALALFYYWFKKVTNETKIRFIFVDEFDAFYHHELSALIVNELKNTGIQFVLTTHNTSIITNELLRPDCYFLLDKKGIRSLSKRSSKELREAHNIEKMYKAGSFNG
ncbi:AAA family ATPase [Chryseobacterium sp. T20]|uniref:AAA family ATPase n=1 Tax=Chryseobacterium sp. T20 TaxID=3395375 RepID=UPI0039BC64C4